MRTAAKADIPHLDDHVSKLHAVGAQTQQKLQNVAEACEQAGVPGVQLPHNTVTTGAPVNDLTTSITETTIFHQIQIPQTIE